MRYIFTDKWNSFWHFFFGLISLKLPFIIPIFILYQALQGKANEIIDMIEFFIGLLTGYLVLKIFTQNKMMMIKFISRS